MALYLSDNKVPCYELAQQYGAVISDADETYCWPVVGKEIPIAVDQVSVMEGFEICNFNMHCSGVKKPAPNQQLQNGQSEQKLNDLDAAQGQYGI